MSIAIFPSLPTGLDLAVQLVGETIQIPGAWASINARSLSSLAKLWQRLNCYRDSLDSPDRGALLSGENSVSSIPWWGVKDIGVLSPCQFICTPCMRMIQDQSTIDVENRFEVADGQKSLGVRTSRCRDPAVRPDEHSSRLTSDLRKVDQWIGGGDDGPADLAPCACGGQLDRRDDLLVGCAGAGAQA